MICVDAAVNHSVGVVTARLTAASSDNLAIMYTVLPGSILAVNKFNQPVTAPSANHDFMVCSVVFVKFYF